MSHDQDGANHSQPHDRTAIRELLLERFTSVYNRHHSCYNQLCTWWVGQRSPSIQAGPVRLRCRA